MIRAIARASVTEITGRRRSSTGERMLSKFKREKTFVAGPRAAGKNWRVRAVPVTGVAWEKKRASGTEVGWEIRVVWQIGVAVGAA